MNIPPKVPNPHMSVERRTRLVVLTLAGDEHADALLSVTNGRPISPEKQLLAAEGLKQARPALYDRALELSSRRGQWKVGPVNSIMVILKFALQPLMLNAADLPWAARMLAATLADAACPLAPELASPQNLEDAWQLAPEFLTYASQICPPADLKRAWHETDTTLWRAAAAAWLHTRDAAACQALTATRFHLDLDTPGETLHWLACDAVRRGLPIPEGSPRLIPPIPVPILLRLPAPPGPLLGQLHALARMGDPGATALARLCGGEVVVPDDQPLALETLTRLQPTVMQTTPQPFNIDRDDPDFDRLKPWMPILEDALSPLVHDPADLPWAARILTAWQMPLGAPDMDMRGLVVMWSLSASILAYVRENGRADDLQRPWRKLDHKAWSYMVGEWPFLSTRGYQPAVFCITGHLGMRTLAECMHWLAREGLRQERHAFHSTLTSGDP